MIKYVAGSNKGNTQQGDVFNDPFRLGKVDPQYTSSRVTKDYNLTEATTAFTMDWKPVIPGTISVVAGTTTYVDDGKGMLIAVEAGSSVARRTVMVQPVDDATAMGDLRLEGVQPTVEVVVTDSTGAPVEASAGTVDYAAGTITFTTGLEGAVQVAYSYNNVNIPQNDIPLLSAKMEAMPLLAKPRRIAIYYSQMAAFQAKTDYGLDLGDQLAEKAVGQLAYEIDTEVVNLLVSNAVVDADLAWSKTIPIGISLKQHYEGFQEKIEVAKQKVYQKTQRFMPNYMLVSSTIMPVVAMIDAFRPSDVTKINGPYFAGTLNGMKIYVTPSIPEGRYVLGVHAGDKSLEVSYCSNTIKTTM